MLGYVVRASLHGVGVFSESVRCCWWMVSNGRMYTHASTCMCIICTYAFYLDSAYPDAHTQRCTPMHTQHTYGNNCILQELQIISDFLARLVSPFFFSLYHALGGAKQGVADNFALRLLLLFDQLREVASSRRSDLPDDDPVSTLELIIFFLGSVQTQIQHMQVSLLES